MRVDEMFYDHNVFSGNIFKRLKKRVKNIRSKKRYAIQTPDAEYSISPTGIDYRQLDTAPAPQPAPFIDFKNVNPAVYFIPAGLIAVILFTRPAKKGIKK